MSIRLAFAAIVALGLAAGPASAADMMGKPMPKGWYASGSLGGAIARDSDFSGTGINTTADFDTGWAANAAIGHSYGNGFRTEIELGYRANDVDTLSGTSSGTGDTSALSLMVNGAYDFQTSTPFTPYLGLGLGMARVKADGISPVGGSRIDDTDTVFAYQGIAGLSYSLNDRLSLFADYRYFATADPSFTTDSGVGVDGEYAAHQVMVGLRWSFGAPMKAPMAETKPMAKPMAEQAPAPKPAMAPKPAAPEPPRKYLVFFDWDKDAIRPDAQAILEEAARNYPKLTVIQVATTGHADRSGPDWYNMDLSKRRAQNVAAALARLHIPLDKIAVDYKGEREPLVPTPDGVREPQNRRVEIVFK